MRYLNRSKKNVIILLRWLLIMVFLAMLLSGSRDFYLVRGKLIYILLFVISNIALVFVPKEYFTRRSLDFVIILADTAIISGGIYLTGDTELYYIYFLSIIVAALGRSIKGSVLVAFIASFFYILIILKTTEINVLQPGFLVRFPFFFIIALVSSFLAEDASVQREHLKKTGFLLDLVQSLSSTINSNKIFEIVIDKISKMEDVDSCSVFQIDDAKNNFVLKHLWGAKDINGVSGFSISVSDIGDSINSKVFQKMKSIVLGTHEIQKDRQKFPYFWPDSTSQAIVPIVSKNVLLGTINIGSRRIDSFDEEEIEILNIVANQTASALENARLFKDIGQNAMELSSLSDISKVVNSTLDLKEVLNSVMKMTSKVLEVEVCSLLLLDEAANELVFEVALGEKGDVVKEFRLKIGEGIAGWVAEKGEPLLVQDVQADARFYKKVDEKSEFITSSILAVPMKSKGRLIGVAEAINKLEDKEFSERDVEFFNAIVNQAAIAVENAKLYKSMEDKVAETERLNKILYEEKSKIESILNSMAAGVVVVDTTGAMAFLNYSARNILTYSNKNSLQNNRYYKDLMLLLKKSVTREASTDKIEKMVIEKEGEDVNIFNTRVSLIKGRQGEVLGAICVLEDITELEKLSELKSDFVSQVSHELRTPLTSIKGATKLILRGSTGVINEKQTKLLKIMNEDTDRLINLISDLLDIAKLESGKIKMKKEDFDLSDVLRQCVETIQSLAKDKNHKVFEKFNSSLKVNADKDRIKQVVINLLSNAIKFTPPEGQIEILARQVNGLSEVCVKDSGMGVPKEFQVKLFEKFQRADNSMTAEVQGTGLGLAICKKIVEDHGGKIWVESEINKGSSFFFTLPG
jgi:PAS domain S-box-containing protein